MVFRYTLRVHASHRQKEKRIAEEEENVSFLIPCFPKAETQGITFWDDLRVKVARRVTEVISSLTEGIK